MPITCWIPWTAATRQAPASREHERWRSRHVRRTSREVHGCGRGENFFLPPRASHSELRLRSRRHTIHPDMTRSPDTRARFRTFFSPRPSESRRREQSVRPPQTDKRSLRSSRPLRITVCNGADSAHVRRSANKALPRGDVGDQAQLQSRMHVRASRQSRPHLGPKCSRSRRS